MVLIKQELLVYTASFSGLLVACFLKLLFNVAISFFDEEVVWWLRRIEPEDVWDPYIKAARKRFLYF